MSDEQRREIRRVLSGQEDEPVELKTGVQDDMADEMPKQVQTVASGQAQVPLERVLAFVDQLDPRTLQLAVACARIEQLEAQVRHASAKGEMQEE